GCRRTTFEWVLRRYVTATPGVTIVSGIAERLLARSGKPPRLWGIEATIDGRRQTVAADIVVDATGRGTRVADWLTEIGAARPFERRSSSSLLYYTRFYRRRADREFPAPTREPTMADFGWIKYAIFPADNQAYSITL